MTQGAVRAPQRSPATKVWVFQWPKGALERRRSPLSQRPRARVIFVLVPVSSMNTSLWGSVRILGCRSGCQSALNFAPRSASKIGPFWGLGADGSARPGEAGRGCAAGAGAGSEEPPVRGSGAVLEAPAVVASFNDVAVMS